jgi:apolipoprotein N-acyltransferase
MMRTRYWLLLGAVAWAMAYPPLPLGFLAFVALVPLFWVTARVTPSKAFRYHFFAGIVYNALMYWWIYNVIAVGPGLAIGGGLLLLILFLSLFNGLQGWLFRMCFGIRGGLFLFPFLWAGLEAARAYGQMSFPWNSLGYTLGNYLPLIQCTRLIGVYGLSILIVTVNLLLFQAWNARGKKRKLWVAVAAVIPLGLALDGWIRLYQPTPSNPNLDIALIQPSIPQTKKWEEAYFLEVMAKTWKAMDHFPGGLKGADLVVLPETAIPDFIRTRREVVREFHSRSDALQAPILLGALDFVNDRTPWREYIFFNSAFLFSPNNDTLRQYNKLHLVPFSEKLPFDNIFPVINYVNLGEGDFSEGKTHVVWGGDTAYSPSICYEVIYPSHIREARRMGAKLLINITNDGWFGRSNAPYQHANIARFRAIEVGAPLARCANTGISVFYDYRGSILGHTQLMENTAIRCKLPRYQESTFYLRHGDAFEFGLLMIFWIGTVGLAGWAFKNRRAPQGSTPA